jgi:hypothetical protein
MGFTSTFGETPLAPTACARKNGFRTLLLGHIYTWAELTSVCA